MPTILLEHWQATELFCRVAAKFEEIDFKEYSQGEKSNNYIRDSLETYQHPEKAKKVSAKIFGKRSDLKGKAVPANPSAFYNLGLSVRYMRPITMDEAMLKKYLDYINDPAYDLETRQYVHEWHLPSVKQRLLENTTWFLYHYDEKHIGDLGEITQTGVTRCVLELKPFNNAVLYAYKVSVDTIERYVGHYEMYGKDERFVKIKMKIYPAREKDLLLLFYIGIGIPQLALGLYKNIGRSMYSGSFMLEPVKKEMPQGPHTLASFFPHSDPEIKKHIPEYAIAYCEDKRKNMLRVPSEVTSQIDFLKWKKSKEIEQEIKEAQRKKRADQSSGIDAQ